MAQWLLKPAPIVAALREKLLKCRHNLFAVKHAVNLKTIEEAADRAFAKAEEKLTLAVSRYLDETGTAHSSAVLYSLKLSGAEGVDDFPEIPEKHRVALSS